MPDLLDYISDNQRERRREVYRNGRLVAHVRAGIDAPLLKAFGARGEFGAFPDRAQQQEITQ